MINKIKEHGFVKSQSCQPSLISFFDKATGILDDGEAENTNEAFCIFSRDSLRQAEKIPSKNNQSSTGRVTTPREEWIKGEGGFSSLHYGSRGGAVNLPLHTANGLPFSNLAVNSFAQGQLLAQGKLRPNLCHAHF